MSHAVGHARLMGGVFFLFFFLPIKHKANLLFFFSWSNEIRYSIAFSLKSGKCHVNNNHYSLKTEPILKAS